MIVLKFGGSSLANLHNLNNIKEIIKINANNNHKQCVIVSAVAGVTNSLAKCALKAKEANYNACRLKINEIKDKYIELCELAKPREHTINYEKLLDYIQQLDSILYGLCLTRDYTPRILDTIIGYGELCSTWLIKEILYKDFPNIVTVDTRKVIITDDNFGEASVDWELTSKNVSSLCEGANTDLYILTGFISGTNEGIPTTLGRNGSDYTASIIASGINAETIYIYSDVDGVLTADPHYVDNAYPLTELTYEEAIDLAFFGAEILHPKTMIPALQKNIPIYIKNVSNLQSLGTVISSFNINNQTRKDDRKIKTVTSIENLLFFYLEWNLINPNVDFSVRLFNIFLKLKIKPWLLNIGALSQNICFAVNVENAHKLVDEIKNDFNSEINKNWMKFTQYTEPVALVSIVGENIVKDINISNKFFNAVHKISGDILAISQGLSQRMISIIIPNKYLEDIVKSVHTAFHFSKKRINLVQYGAGLVGSKLIDIINEFNSKNIDKTHLPEIKYIAISNSKATITNPKSINCKDIKNELSISNKHLSTEEIIDFIKNDRLSNVIFVDMTANNEIIEDYQKVISEGIHVVSSNKKPLTADYSRLISLNELALNKNVSFAYETTVGAGLPVIDLIQSMIKTGDEIYSIEGVFSGTINFICSCINDEMAFSDAVILAKEKGYTEPHPKEDLNGKDVARKALILSRELNLKLNFSDVEIESVIPDYISDNEDLDLFWKDLKSLDKWFSDRVSKLKSENKILRYVASIKNNKIKVGFIEFDINHSIANLSGANNIVVITSKLYDKDNPLIIKGPGAGADVTAAGAFTDILSITERLTS